MLEKYNQFISNLNEIENPLSEQYSLLPVLGLSILNQVQVWHWQTEKGHHHVSLGEFYQTFQELNDKLAEVIIGKYNRFSVMDHSLFDLQDIDTVNMEDWFDDLIGTYQTVKSNYFENQDDIENVIDDILTELQQIKYLLKQD